MTVVAEVPQMYGPMASKCTGDALIKKNKISYGEFGR